MTETDVRSSPHDGASRSLADLLRERQEEVLARWRTAVRECAPAARLREPEFEDHLPLHLQETADAVQAITAGDWGSVPNKGAQRHAVARLAAGFDLAEVMTELFLLRHVLLEFVGRWRPSETRVADAQVVGWAIDAGIRQETEVFTQEKQRTVRALDRLSSLSRESRSLDALLGGLLEIILESAEDVDCVGLFLMEGDRLRMAKAAGLEESEQGLVLRIGEGFSGQIAQERKPASLRAAAQDPSVRGRAVHERGVRALYGVPLISGDDLVGVLRMGSLTVEEFSDSDRTLLRAVADRAAAFIVQHRLQDETERLARSRDEALAILSTIYETAPIGLAAFDGELRFTRVNRALAEIDGSPPEAHLGRRVVEVVPGLQRVRELEEGWRRVLETGEPWLGVEVEVLGETAAAPGERRHWIASYYPVRSGGGVVGMGAVVQEVTEQRRAADFRRHVLGIVGHDLRDPLAVIRMSSDVLLHSEDITERQSKGLARISSAAVRAEAIVRDLLDYSWVRAGKGVPVQRRTADLAEVCRLALEQAEASNPDRLFHRDGPEPVEGDWDPDRLSQLLANLLRNAASYGAPETEVVLRWSAFADHVVLEVLNYGPPITAELLSRIFEPFQCGTELRPQATRQRGLGLGLFIAREIVRAHSGQISASSFDGQTVFRVTLPRRDPNPPAGRRS